MAGLDAGLLGGFGVMNGDAEWNDARQSLFAELIAAAEAWNRMADHGRIAG